MAVSTKGKKARAKPAARTRRARREPSIAARIADLAWAGQHDKAIELATTALDAADLTSASRLALLDLRAESLVAQGNLGRAHADADAMLDLPARARSSAFVAQARSRLALV